MRQPDGDVVVVTGASSGIGRATALAFARQKAKLILAGRNPQALDEVADECRRLGARAEVAGLVLPCCNTKAMALHLAEISQAVAPGAHAVLLLDQAGGHLPSPSSRCASTRRMVHGIANTSRPWASHQCRVGRAGRTPMIAAASPKRRKI